MVSIAVVEDDLEYQKQLLQYIEQYKKEHKIQCKVAVFSNGLNFLEDYKGGGDLIFMDIAMPHMNGLEAAALLRKKDAEVCLIFITSLAQYALQGYEVNALSPEPEMETPASSSRIACRILFSSWLFS